MNGCLKGWSWAASREGQAQLDWRRRGHFRHGFTSSPLHWACKPCTTERICLLFSYLSLSLSFPLSSHTCRTAALSLMFNREGRGVRYPHMQRGNGAPRLGGWGFECMNNWWFFVQWDESFKWCFLRIEITWKHQALDCKIQSMVSQNLTYSLIVFFLYCPSI